jgi:23S rRNA (uracil1939-C5)-methyltransferase
VGLQAGAVVTLEVEKAVAGGRMLARHEGQVVLLSGAIPGERVSARVTRAGKGLAQAETLEVLSASPDRRAADDGCCGGNLFAHIAYERQRHLKGAIIRDALSRVGRIPLDADPDVLSSPEHGYRLRARLHVQGRRVGFYREGTHDICSAAATGQLASATTAWLTHVEATLATVKDSAARGLVGVELSENMAGDQRAVHLVLADGASARPFAGLAEGVTGLSAQAGEGRPTTLAGHTDLVDQVRPANEAAQPLTLHREVRAFFQGNRFLVEPLARAVLARLPAAPVIDLYAGVGLFGLLHACATGLPAVLVEGDPISSADLLRNAQPYQAHTTVVRRSVESYLASAPAAGDATVVIDPPRTGLSKEALAGLLAMRPARIVSVSCDVATFARDARALADAGYQLRDLVGVDLFPNTAHVETLSTFVR